MGPAFDYVNKLILKELEDGKFVLAAGKPVCVHALGAVPKSKGSFRPITDCKRPLYSSINNYMDTTFETFSYASTDQVCDLMTWGCFMATVDIASAYRSVSINPDQWKYQGISWPMGEETTTYLFDVRLSFGLRCAPFIFTQLSDFVVRTMDRLGFYNVISYIDDFIVVEPTRERCVQAQAVLFELLGSLGFEVSWSKCAAPATRVRYLGIDFDSMDMTLSLPKDKLDKLFCELKFFEGRTRTTKRQVQRLCGILAHASKVIRGGRVFSRRIIDMLKDLPPGNPRVRITEDFLLDLEWWRQFSVDFNGKAHLIHNNFGQGPELFTDACLKGYGFAWGCQWQAGAFETNCIPIDIPYVDTTHNHWLNVPICDDVSIKYLELVAIFLAVQRFANVWRDQHVLCYTDNTQAMSAVNRGTSVSKDSMCVIRQIFWICARYNIYLSAKHVAGEVNLLADWLSRACVRGYLGINNLPLCCKSMEMLDREVSQAVSAAWSSNTLATRNSQWKTFIVFCSSNGLQPLPADHQTVSRFLVWLARRSKFSTINNYLSAITVLHKYYGYDGDFRSSFLIKLVLQGLKRQLGTKLDQKLPFTLGQLRSMYGVFDHRDNLKMALWAVMIFCFRTLLRKSNVLPDATGKLHHVIRRSDLEFHQWGILVHVRSSKTVQFEEYIMDIPINTVSDKAFCVVSLIKDHFSVFPAPGDSPLFLRNTAHGVAPVLYGDLLLFIKKLASDVGLDQSKYGSHSMRRSGAGFLHDLKVPLTDIMTLGNWSSMSVLSYLVTPEPRKHAIQGAVGLALSATGLDS